MPKVPPEVLAPVGSGLPRLLTETELAPLLRLSVGFLQRDRRERKLIPFVRIGDRVLYDPAVVGEALKGGLAEGGAAPRRVPRRQSAVATA